MSLFQATCAYCGAERGCIKAEPQGPRERRRDMCMGCASPAHYTEVEDYYAAHHGEPPGSLTPFPQWKAEQA